MPGKQMGMSDTCYPDSLIGALPNLYYYAANNPSEATIAKRRGYAETISYLTPPAENAGLYKGLKELGELVGSYQQLREGSRGVQIVNAVVETARQCNLDKDVQLPEVDAAELDLDAMDHGSPVLSPLPPVDNAALSDAARRMLQSGAINLDDALGRWERAFVDAALQQTHGNLARAARLLGLARSTLYSRMQNYGEIGRAHV